MCHRVPGSPDGVGTLKFVNFDLDYPTVAANPEFIRPFYSELFTFGTRAHQGSYAIGCHGAADFAQKNYATVFVGQ
jgi:hypothetical protein